MYKTFTSKKILKTHLRCLAVVIAVLLFSLNSNAQCTQTVTVTASPLPVNGNYQFGQTVTFCVTVTGYNLVASNWLDGVTGSFGNGWDISTITPVGQPTTAGSSGTWVWMPLCTSSATGQTAGPGWFFDLNNDGNGGNDYGDYSTTGPWTFCFSITTNPNSANGTNLDVIIDTWADGEIGSWSSFNCNNDPLFYPYPNGSTTLPNCTPFPVNIVTVDVSCGAPGSATATPAGGQAPYNYVWTDAVGTVLQTNNGINGPSTLPGLQQGAYNLAVTDAAGCLVVSQFNIIRPPFLSITAQTVDASCTGICNGQATITPVDATGNVTYSWTPNVTSSASSTTLCEGNYTVIATDATGCADTVAFTINVTYVVSTTVASVDPTCFNTCNGQITITPQLGQAPFTSTWTPTNFVGGTNNAVCDGTYYITTTDVNGCFKIDTVTVVEPPELLGADFPVAESCPGFCDGSVLVSIGGGTSPYAIAWTPVQTPDSILANLCGGNYDYQVTDANGCIFNSSTTITTNPQPIVNFYSNAGALNEFNTDVLFTDNSGSDVISWAWDFDGMGTSNNENPTFDFGAGGDYDVTLIGTNTRGCSDTITQTITIAPLQVLYVPNAFTPNHDGINEIFRPQGVIGVDDEYEMRIFDRWGQNLFISKDFTKGWDGTHKDNNVMVDVYIYKIVISNEEKDISKEYVGHVALIR